MTPAMLGQYEAITWGTRFEAFEAATTSCRRLRAKTNFTVSFTNLKKTLIPSLPRSNHKDGIKVREIEKDAAH